MQHEEATTARRFVLFELGFRPFFLAAGMFAVIGMLLWGLAYLFSVALPLAGLPPVVWHGHEMIYGYAIAVVAGFLLTAVSNWTGIRTWRGTRLATLLILWFVARIAWFIPFEFSLPLSAVADLLFMLGLIASVSLPVIRVRQWKQLGLLSKLWLILVANGLFYAGAMGYLDQGVRWGLYLGLYLLLALVFVMARRVLPFFIERGVEEHFVPRNRRWVDIASLVLFLIWSLLDVFTRQTMLVGWLSIGLLGLHAVRLYDWHTPGIWKKPLLWSLYLSYVFITFAFLLKVLSVWQGLSPYLVVHAFGVGGLGLMTVGMMSRVALGHTGRNVFDPPRVLTPLFSVIVLAMLARVMLPVIDSAHYTLWIGLSQALWMLGFAVFSAVYIPLLVQPRVDGRPG
jgi:uncharacterized protein involved in response to NO